MNAQELFIKDGKSAGVFYCPVCLFVSRSRELAEACCKPRICDKCGLEIEKHSYCHPCHDKAERAKEQARFEAAEKLTTWDGWVFSEGHGYNEGFAASVDDLFDAVESPDDIPDYVWTCDPVPFVFASLDDIKQRIEESEDAYEDFDANDCEGLPELEKAIEAFNEANKGTVSYHPNYKRALLVDRQKWVKELELL